MRTNAHVVMGLGQMGGAFAHALLRAGRSVHPIIRGQEPARILEELSDVERIVVAVGEASLDAALESIPEGHRDRLLLLQNELLPPAWERHGVVDPTVAVVWFEKKQDKPLKVILPTPIAGPGAEEMAGALGGIGIAAEVIPRERLLLELVAKNLYILTANVGGLRVGGTVGALFDEHEELALAVAKDILALEAAKLGEALDEAALMARMREAVDGDPEHGAMGRSAPARLARALADAERLGIEVPTLTSIAAERG